MRNLSRSEAVDAPVVVDSVQVENIDFSDAYEKRMRAEVAIKTREQPAAHHVTNIDDLAFSSGGWVCSIGDGCGAQFPA